MPYSHVVSFKYHSHVAEATRAEVYRRFLDLKNLCTVDSDRRDKSQGSASTGLYIASLIGGQANISLEGAGRGFDHLFVVTFCNADHARYYLDEDPAHCDFKNFVSPFIEDAFIYDFE